MLVIPSVLPSVIGVFYWLAILTWSHAMHVFGMILLGPHGSLAVVVIRTLRTSRTTLCNEMRFHIFIFADEVHTFGLLSFIGKFKVLKNELWVCRGKIFSASLTWLYPLLSEIFCLASCHFKLELYIESVFFGPYRSVFFVIYRTDTNGKLGRYNSVSKRG